MKNKEIDMTSGPLAKNIIIYAIPLMLSNLLQILFNLADVAVVGKFSGPIALGAVGSTSIIIMLTTGILLGMSGGVNAVVALFVGSKDIEKEQKAIHTSLIICLVSGILLLAAGLIFTRPVLKLIGTKNELINGACVYLTIYLLGSPALALYNYGNAVLSSIGDTKRPLMYLMTAGIINVCLNMVFVLGFKMSVSGVALASIISQYISAILMMRYLLTCNKEYGLYIKKICYDRRIANMVIQIGIPAAIQYTLFAVANLYIQSAINSFDHVIVEGNSAAANSDNLVYDMMAAFYTACTSFIAQNYGAGNKARIRRTYLITLCYSALVALILGGILLLCKGQFLLLFTSDAKVIHYGKIRLTIMASSYFISAFMDDAAAAARGLGKSVVPTIIVIMGSVVFRIIWVCTVFAYYHTLPSLYLVYASSWSFTAIAANIYWIVIYRRVKNS